MASGFDCDDDGEDRPGNEDNITQQDANPDWYNMILDLGMIRDPGAKAVYCSINPHLAGGVLSRVAKRSLPDMMWTLVGEPLEMRDYYMQVTPLKEGYMGGGMRFRARDFMKLGQLYLNGGTWKGRRIVSTDWVKRSTTPRYVIGNEKEPNYGSLWWRNSFQFEGRTIRSFSALGNGGQNIIVLPELDMVITAFAGNYNERAAGTLINVLIPRYILPAVVGK
jgi:CubicO group peptidase (beta-lactamase class C family)